MLQGGKMSKKIIKKIANAMSKEATEVFEEEVKIKIPKKAITQLSAWDGYTDESVYACQCDGLVIIAYVKDKEVLETKVVR